MEEKIIFEEQSKLEETLSKLEEEKGDDITPTDYFEAVKGCRRSITDSKLGLFLDNAMAMYNKALVTEQTYLLSRLEAVIKNVDRERKALNLGINTYVLKEDVEEFITKVSKKVVKIITMSEYPREIPDEIIEVVALAKKNKLFDEYYIVFTDYTGKVEKQVEKEKRDKDPILFGAFKDGRHVSQRFYFLGDWEDEHCDLTLDRLITETKAKLNKDIEQKVKVPEDIEGIKKEMHFLTNSGRDSFNFNIGANENKKEEPKKFWSKVKTIFTR